MKKLLETYINGRLDRFTILYEGLAYWFEMKDQYLYKVTLEDEFKQFWYDHRGDLHPKFVFRHLNGSIFTPKKLVVTRRWYFATGVNKEGYKRIGLELLPEYREMYGTELPVTKSAETYTKQEVTWANYSHREKRLTWQYEGRNYEQTGDFYIDSRSVLHCWFVPIGETEEIEFEIKIDQ